LLITRGHPDKQLIALFSGIPLPSTPDIGCGISVHVASYAMCENTYISTDPSCGNPDANKYGNNHNISSSIPCNDNSNLLELYIITDFRSSYSQLIQKGDMFDCDTE
jgi:hypothetical protein